MRPFELRGEEILLATPTGADVDTITRLCQDSDVQRWTTVPVPYSRTDSEQFVAHVTEGWDTGTDLTWAVRDPRNRAVLGMVGLNLRGGAGSGEVGYWLGPAGRGRGLMTAAVRRVAEHAFAPEGLGLKRLLWYAHVGNWPSRRVAWRLGFTFEATIRSHLIQRGERRDAWVATLLAGDPMEPNGRWHDAPVLEGARVTLRRFAESDADACVEACTDPVTRHWLGRLPDPYTREVALEYIRSLEIEHAAGRAVHWAATRAAGPAGDAATAVGSFSLMSIGTAPGPGSAEVGYWVHPAARGEGVATEAVRLMVKHAFTSESEGGLGLRRLVLARAEGNDASARVAERAGFRAYGIARRAERLGDGTDADLHWYDLLAD